MEDIAHDASGPASPKPGDIAPQQARQHSYSYCHSLWGVLGAILQPSQLIC